MKDSPRRNTSVQWPTEVDAYLDHLVRLAASRGVLISRAQMLSALASEASADAADIAALAQRYLGGCRVGDLTRKAADAAQLPAVRHRGRQRAAPS
uniref:hypothetical protein n=1 Tax=Paractinoplanes polyasparticus TaxID=2856853 RepID=UPI002102F150|nr:hypothetical protein [Actinoplanes polyasparticus]